jgi:hypothetical protein
MPLCRECYQLGREVCAWVRCSRPWVLGGVVGVRFYEEEVVVVLS